MLVQKTLAVLKSISILLYSIQVKETSLSYHLEKVFNVDIPKLQHETDGLIYTPVTTPYVPGTDINMFVFFVLPTSLIVLIQGFAD